MSKGDRLYALRQFNGGGMGAGTLWWVDDNADALLPILARFASPEVKREVLRTLLAEVEATGLVEDFAGWMDKEYPPHTVIGSGAWHARPIWRYLRHRICQRDLAALRDELTEEGKDGK